MEGGVNPITKLSGDGNQDIRSGAVRSWLCIRASEPDSSDGELEEYNLCRSSRQDVRTPFFTGYNLINR
jgi:hypothetical protein